MRIVVNEFMSLDGVVQAPGGQSEDTDGGFAHGGWSVPFFDPELMGTEINAGMETADALMFGRRTRRGMADAWPGRADDPYADQMNALPKYVASRMQSRSRTRTTTQGSISAPRGAPTPSRSSRFCATMARSWRSRDDDAYALPAAASGRLTMAKTTYGTTRDGVPFTDELVAELVEKAEAGDDVDQILRRRGGRPPMGSGAASVESVRLDPELREALARRAEHDQETTSAVIRRALRQ
jgi:hypothetical protein